MHHLLTQGYLSTEFKPKYDLTLYENFRESELKSYNSCVLSTLWLPGVFVLEAASGKSCCPVAVLPPHRDLPHYCHGGASPGVGGRARGDRGGRDGHIGTDLDFCVCETFIYFYTKPLINFFLCNLHQIVSFLFLHKRNSHKYCLVLYKFNFISNCTHHEHRDEHIKK